MAFDPVTGALWETENADDAYSELNHIIPGMNGGWVQFAGPISRIADWKFIETTQFGGALQQVRYPPTRAAYTAAQALSQMFMLPGATYVDPDFSWRYEIGPAGTTFLTGNALGPEYNGTLWMGSARSNAMVGANGGSLYRFRMTPDRMHVDVSADPRLADRVADNVFRPQKFDGTESETLQIGTGFGITPDIEQGPDGNLYVVSNTDNVIYKISRVTPGPQPKPPGRNGGGSKFDGQLSESPSFGRVAIDLDRMSSAPSFGDSMAGVSPLTISTKQLLSSDNQLSLRSFEESVRQSSKRSEDVRDSNTRIAGQGWHPLLGTGLTTNDCADTEST
jgi:hypothetical protein